MVGGKDDNGFGICFRPSEKSISFLLFWGGGMDYRTPSRGVPLFNMGFKCFGKWDEVLGVLNRAPQGRGIHFGVGVCVDKHHDWTSRSRDQVRKDGIAHI